MDHGPRKNSLHLRTDLDQGEDPGMCFSLSLTLLNKVFGLGGGLRWTVTLHTRFLLSYIQTQTKLGAKQGCIASIQSFCFFFKVSTQKKHTPQTHNNTQTHT